MENDKKKMSFTLFWSILVPCIGAAFTVGYYLGLSNGPTGYIHQNITLVSKVDSLNRKIHSLRDSLYSVPSTVYDVFTNGTFNQGLNMGVNTSEGKTKWVEVSNGEIRMTYPKGQSWGAVFVTAGKPIPLGKRGKMDFSKYAKLVLELKGEKGATVQVGLKDNLDPDDGSESKVTLNIENEWKEYEIDLKNFETADLRNLYIVTEFVFANNPQTLSVRKIQFK